MTKKKLKYQIVNNRKIPRADNFKCFYKDYSLQAENCKKKFPIKPMEVKLKTNENWLIKIIKTIFNL